MGKTIVVSNIVVIILVMVQADHAWDTNPEFNPCLDTKIKRMDPFPFGVAFSTNESFFLNQTQFSPCDSRVFLSKKNVQLGAFSSKVDQVSVLTINSSTFNLTVVGGFMVAFAGRQNAVKSEPVSVANGTNTKNSFTLVFDFQHGILQGLSWKEYECESCSTIPNSQCKTNGGLVDCDIRIQLVYNGHDKNDNMLSTWYEVSYFQKEAPNVPYINPADARSSPFNYVY